MNIYVEWTLVNQEVGYHYFSEGVYAWVQFTKEIRQENLWHNK